MEKSRKLIGFGFKFQAILTLFNQYITNINNTKEDLGNDTLKLKGL